MDSSYFLLGLIGLAAGFVVSAGAVALIVELGIIPRFAGITHTAHHILLYENVVFWGAAFGNTCFLFGYPIPVGRFFLPILGLFAGAFVGAWIIALAEVVNVFPVLFRRLKITQGLHLLVISIAAGKILGALLHFFKRW